MILYLISLILNSFILTFGLFLHPEYFKAMVMLKHSYLFLFLITLLAAYGAIHYVKFESWLYKAFLSSLRKQRSISLFGNPLNKNMGFRKTHFYYDTPILIFAGMTEEIIFRGFAYHKHTLLFIATIAFGFSHIFAGWLQCLSKTILSLFLTLFLIISGTIIIPAFAHALFNVCAYRHAYLKESVQ